MFARCPLLAVERARLSQQFGIPQGWWASQPRVTAKSGWVTLGAAASEAQRVDRQIAACILGMSIVQMGDMASETDT